MDLDHVVSFSIMFLISIIVSVLASRSKMNERMAIKREKDAKQLYEISSKLSAAVSVEEILNISVTYFREMLGLQTALLLCSPDGMTHDTYLFCGLDGNTEVRNVLVNRNIVKCDKDSGKGYLIGNLYYEWPLVGSESIFGYAGFIPEEIEKEILKT